MFSPSYKVKYSTVNALALGQTYTVKEKLATILFIQFFYFVEEKRNVFMKKNFKKS